MIKRFLLGIIFVVLAGWPAFGADVIKIGSMNALSGPFGVLGVDQSKATKLAVDEINAQGGILGKKVEILIRDDEASPAAAARVSRKLVLEDKVDFLVGGNGSPASFAIAETAKRFKKIYLSSGGAMGAGLTGKDCNRYTFRINHSGVQFYRADAAYVAKTFPDIKTVGGINPDYSYGHEMWEGFISELKKHKPGIKVVEEMFVPMSEKDYTNYISALIDKKPDLVYSVFWSGAGVAFARQAAPYGLFDKTKFYLAAAGIGTTMTSLGKHMVRMWGSEPADWQLDNPMNKKLVAAFMKVTDGKVPHAFVAQSYATIMILKQAIEKAKSMEPSKVIAALEGGTFDTPWGKTLIRKCDHQAMGKVFIGQAKPTKNLPFWALQNPTVIPCQEVSPSCKETGCVLR